MAILTHFLRPSLPSSLQDLRPYLDILANTVQFEEELLSTHTQSRTIRDWAADVAKHYERKRREDFWQKTRTVAMKPDDGLTFEVEVPIKLPTPSWVEVPPAQKADLSKSEDFSAWDDEEASGWGFNETVEDEDIEPVNSDTLDQEVSGVLREDDMDDETDGWGWDEEADPAESSGILEQASKSVDGSSIRLAGDDSSWESDNWSTEPGSSPSQPGSSPKAGLPIAAPAPKLAKRLEKYSSKTKGGSAHPTTDNKPVPPPPPPRPPVSVVAAQNIRPNIEQIRPMERQPQEVKETYLASLRTRTVLDLVEQIIREGEELLNSSVFTTHGSTVVFVPGQLLLAAAPSVLDLYRAIFPITHGYLLENPSFVMQWSNDCLYLAKEVSTRWAETGERFQILADLNFENAIVREQEIVQGILRRAGGFVNASKEDRYLECRDAVQGTLQELEDIAAKWKTMLIRDNYFRAIGRVVDDALFRILDNVLLLEDIPEDDSERLSELCEMFNVLEKLFAYGSTVQSMIGSYVPLWFKFSYLSWLIKGSLADISYLFDEGMLVDYEIDELIRLVRALFAETPLRENTITKFMQGHPSLEPAKK